MAHYPKKVFVIIICGLINYRNQQNLILPTKGAGKINDGNSPVRTSTRSLRRQSLTGTETSGSDRSRRSSLGGKPTESSKQHLHRTDVGFLPHVMQLFHDMSFFFALSFAEANDYRNAKTPPPIRPSMQTTKRWM